MQQTTFPTGGNAAGARGGPSLNALRAFEAVGRLGAVSAAANELNITPGAVSRQVKNLEAYLGATLLGRSGRGVRLTAIGEQLWGELESAFVQIAETVKRARQRQIRNTLRIICPPFFASTWLIPRLDTFNRRMPEVDVVIHENLTHTDVKARDADVAISWGQFGNSATFIAERLTVDELFPVCSPRLRPSGGGIAGCTLIHREDVPRFWKWPDWATFLAVAGIDGVDATGGIRLTGSLALDAARQGKGVLIANTTFAHQDLIEGYLVRPVAESMATTCCYNLLTPRTKSDRPEIVAFRAWLLEELADCFGSPGSASAPPPPPPPPPPTPPPEPSRAYA